MSHFDSYLMSVNHEYTLTCDKPMFITGLTFKLRGDLNNFKDLRMIIIIEKDCKDYYKYDLEIGNLVSLCSTQHINGVTTIILPQYMHVDIFRIRDAIIKILLTNVSSCISDIKLIKHSINTGMIVKRHMHIVKFEHVHTTFYSSLIKGLLVFGTVGTLSSFIFAIGSNIYANWDEVMAKLYVQNIRDYIYYLPLNTNVKFEEYNLEGCIPYGDCITYNIGNSCKNFGVYLVTYV